MWKIRKLTTQKLSRKESERDENKLLFKPIGTMVIQKSISFSRQFSSHPGEENFQQAAIFRQAEHS